jgi:hypothetical protein
MSTSSYLRELRDWVRALSEEAAAILAESKGDGPDWAEHFSLWRRSHEGLSGLFAVSVVDGGQLQPELAAQIPLRMRGVLIGEFKLLSPGRRGSTKLLVSDTHAALLKIDSVLTGVLDTETTSAAEHVSVVRAEVERPLPDDDVIASIRARGVRSLGDVTVDVAGLRVLIGDNGAGKSSLVEAIELLRRLPEKSFAAGLNKVHGGLGELLRHGAAGVEIDVLVAGSEGELRYSIERERHKTEERQCSVGEGARSHAETRIHQFEGQLPAASVDGEVDVLHLAAKT